MTEEIRSEDALLRRIADRPEEMWSRMADGTARPSSASMKPHPSDRGLSVDVRRLLPDRTQPTSVLDATPAHGLVEFRAADAFDLNLKVQHGPLPENTAHANVTGFDGMGKSAAKRAQKELAKTAAWVCMPASLRG